MHCTPEVQA